MWFNDLISFSMVGLTIYIWIIGIGMIINEKNERNIQMISWFCIMNLIIIISFLTNNILFFFLCFEGALIPLFVLVGGWGSRKEKEKAALYLFFYTFLSSIFFFITIAYTYSFTGSMNFYQWGNIIGKEWISAAILVPMLVKLPVWPLHLWLPLAHVEAPTVGSVVLAGIVLKLGGYGLIRWWLFIGGGGDSFLTPIIISLGIISLIYAGFISGRQADLKRLIAYSSVGHMGMVAVGIVIGSCLGLKGSVIVMIGHGFTSAGMFASVGIIYLRSHVRTIRYLGGISYGMPIFSFLFILIILGSMGFPPSINFIGELFIINQTIVSSGFILILSITLGLTVGVYYHLFMSIYFIHTLYIFYNSKFC